MFGTAEPFIPAEDREAIRNSLCKTDPAGQRLRFLEYAGPEQGFICEARSNFNPKASAEGWRLLLGQESLV